MPTFKITLAYDGTGFVGWQRQANGTSIQGLLEDAFRELDERAVTVTGAGRTDAGVHARGQVASVSLARTIDARTLIGAINVRLPTAIRVLDAVAVDERFHARFDARRKTYSYRIWNRDVIDPFERLYSWHLSSPALDVEAMEAAARLIEGTHDFAAFQAAGSQTRTSRRTIFSSRVTRQSEALVAYDVAGDGFLRHMVRTIVGTLVEIGRGHHEVAWMTTVLASCDRGQAGPTAPAEGLCLVRVDYDEAPPDARFRANPH